MRVWYRHHLRAFNNRDMTEKDNKKRLKYEIHQPFLLNISIEMWSCFCWFPHPNTMILHFVSFETILVYVYTTYYFLHFESKKQRGTGDYSFDWHSAFHWDGKSVDLAKLNGDIWTDFHRSQRKQRPFDKHMVYHEIQFLPQPMPCGKNEIRFVCVCFFYFGLFRRASSLSHARISISHGNVN